MVWHTYQTAGSAASHQVSQVNTGCIWLAMWAESSDVLITLGKILRVQSENLDFSLEHFQQGLQHGLPMGPGLSIFSITWRIYYVPHIGQCFSAKGVGQHSGGKCSWCWHVVTLVALRSESLRVSGAMGT
jgi:hypothetical protein